MPPVHVSPNNNIVPVQTPVYTENLNANTNGNMGGNTSVQQPIIIPHENDIEYEETMSIATDITESTLSLEAQEIEMIRKSLTRNNGRRKKAAEELGISERTLYRKIKQYNLEQ